MKNNTKDKNNISVIDNQIPTWKQIAPIPMKFFMDSDYKDHYSGFYKRIPAIITSLGFSCRKYEGEKWNINQTVIATSLSKILTDIHTKSHGRNIKELKHCLDWLKERGDIQIVNGYDSFQDVNLNEYIEIQMMCYQFNDENKLSYFINMNLSEFEKIMSFNNDLNQDNLDAIDNYAVYNLFLYIKSMIRREQYMNGHYSVMLIQKDIMKEAGIKSNSSVKSYTQILKNLKLIYFESLPDMLMKKNQYRSSPYFYILTSTPNYMKEIYKDMDEYRTKMEYKGYVFLPGKIHQLDNKSRSYQMSLKNYLRTYGSVDNMPDDKKRKYEEIANALEIHKNNTKVSTIVIDDDDDGNNDYDCYIRD